MHIALLVPDLRGGGAQHMAINMANELTRRGHHVSLLVIQKIGPFQEKVSNSVHIVDLGAKRIMGGILPLSFHLRREKPDVLYSVMTYVNIVALIAKYMSGQFGITTVISERNQFSLNANQKNGKPSLLQRLLIGFFYPLADQIIGISKGVSNDIKGYIWYGQEKVNWIHNPVVTPDLISACSSQSSLLGHKTNDIPLIITSGRLVPQKDHRTLLHAFSLLLQRRPAHLIILGEGSLRTELETYAQDLNISTHVTFQGFVTDPLSLMKEADLFVLSSAWEGFCNVLVEALLCGLPIVSTDCPSGPREILDDGLYGDLIPVGDPVKMADAIEMALARPVDKEAQRNRALKFSVGNICDKYEHLFLDLCQKAA